MTTATEALATFCASLELHAVPAALVAKAKDHLLDTLGVMCAGIDEPHARAVTSTIQQWAGSAEATVIGMALRLPAPRTAFVNALHGRIHTFDDTHEAGPSHPGSAITAAALAAAETAHASGRTLLTALLAGYETATRVSAALGAKHYGAGFHSTGTATPFGAAAAASCARGLDATHTAGALGLAGQCAIGLRQYQRDGSMLDSAMNGARAAEAGVEAAAFAAHGLSGPRGVLDGEWGMLRVMRGSDATVATDDLGARWEFAATQLKPYASCRFTHGPVEVLRSAGLEPAEIEAVEITTFRASVDVSDRPNPRDRTEAVLSHQLAAALAIFGRDILPDDLDTREPAILALAGRVRIRHDPALDAVYPASWPHHIAVTLRSGKVLRMESAQPPGADRAQTRRKFERLATPRFGVEGASAIVSAIEQLEHISDLAPLWCRLGAPAVESA